MSNDQDRDEQFVQQEEYERKENSCAHDEKGERHAESASDSETGLEPSPEENEDSSTSVKSLEEEGDYAADYLEELLDIADIGGDIDIDVENDRASVAILAEGADMVDLKRLVGQDGQVLEALQELTRLAVQQKTGERSRLMLDIADFRAEKRRNLKALAEEAITKVKATGEPVRLDPMNPFERKVCHDVAAEAGCFSESEGQSPHRRVVISLKEDIDEDDE